MVRTSSHRRRSGGRWEAAGQAILAETGDGRLHLAAEQRSLPPANLAQGMIYQHSDDDGRSWSAARVLENGGQPPAIWASLEPAGDRALHLVWASGSSDRTFIWHQTSIDGGDTWSEAVQVNSLPVGELPAATVDPAGQPHVVGLDNGRLQHWSWNGTEWLANESRFTNLTTGQLDVAAILPGELVVGHLGQPVGSAAEQPITQLSGLTRPIDLSAADLPAEPEPIPPVPVGVPTVAPPAPTPMLEPTPTIVIPAAVEQSNGFLNGLIGASGPWGRSVLPSSRRRW